jgi:hypothetical protein
MKKRKTFLIRWLVASDREQNENSVIDIEYIQTGDKLRVSTIEEAAKWMENSETQNQQQGIQINKAN